MRNAVWVWFVWGLLGCQGTDAEGPAGPKMNGDGSTDSNLPCEVERVLTNYCVRCHSSPPKGGSPMPLTSHDALHATSVIDDVSPVYERVAARIHDTEDPMPPSNIDSRPSAEELAILDAWLAQDAPARAADEDPAACDIEAPVEEQVGPEYLDCEPENLVTLTTHAEGSLAEPYHVPVDAVNEYTCFTFRSPFQDGQQATSWAPNIGDPRVVHHYILFSTESEQVDGGVGPCHMPTDAQFIMGWAPGGGNSEMPPNVGLELPGAGSSMILQIHYYNAPGYTDSFDKTGITLCTTPPGEARAETAGILRLGSVRIDIPPRATDHEVVGTCSAAMTSRLDAPIHVLASGPHMHKLGSRFETRILHEGDPEQSEMMVKVDAWDFEDQGQHPQRVPLVINPGDAIETRCVYDNPSDQPVRFGEGTEDEMCFNFVMVYPIDAVPSSRSCGIL